LAEHIALRVDPKNPKTYRFKAHARTTAQARRSSAIE